MEEESTVGESEQQVYWKKFSFEPEPIVQINPDDPVDSFNAMISYQKKDLVGKAISEMAQFIENKFSLNDASHQKVIVESLATLRRGCIR